MTSTTASESYWGFDTLVVDYLEHYNSHRPHRSSVSSRPCRRQGRRSALACQGARTLHLGSRGRCSSGQGMVCGDLAGIIE